MGLRGSLPAQSYQEYFRQPKWSQVPRLAGEPGSHTDLRAPAAPRAGPDLRDKGRDVQDLGQSHRPGPAQGRGKCWGGTQTITVLGRQRLRTLICRENSIV